MNGTKKIGSLQIEIFNPGVPINKKELENLFVPFFHQNPREQVSACPSHCWWQRKTLATFFWNRSPTRE